MHAILKADGQITVPKAIREQLGLHEGDRFLIEINGHGHLQLVPDNDSAPPLGGLVGLLNHLAPAQPVTVEEMNAAIRQRAQRSFKP